MCQKGVPKSKHIISYKTKIINIYFSPQHASAIITVFIITGNTSILPSLPKSVFFPATAVETKNNNKEYKYVNI